MLFVLKKEQVEHARLRALAQAIVEKDKAKEVFDDYMRVAFPWLETSKRREKDDIIKVLQGEVKKGAMGIKPLWQGERMRSRLKHRVVERDEAPKKTREEMDALYAKLGRVIPI